MSDEVEVASQPASNAAEIVRQRFADFQPEPDVQVDEPEAAQEPEAYDPATIRIPNRFSTNVPKALEKFKDKTLVDFATSYEEAEKAMHSKAQEAAQARRENEELKARLAAAEQYARMSQTPQQPQVTDPYQRAGVNLDEAIITDPRSVMRTTLSEAQRVAREEAIAAARSERQALEKSMQEQAWTAQVVTALELARQAVNKEGHEFTPEAWEAEMQYIAPVVHREGRITDHTAIVDHFHRVKGIAKVSVPTEGNPPVAARPTAIKSEKQIPTLTREEQQMNKRIRAALGLEK